MHKIFNCNCGMLIGFKIKLKTGARGKESTKVWITQQQEKKEETLTDVAQSLPCVGIYLLSSD